MDNKYIQKRIEDLLKEDIEYLEEQKKKAVVARDAVVCAKGTIEEKKAAVLNLSIVETSLSLKRSITKEITAALNYLEAMRDYIIKEMDLK